MAGMTKEEAIKEIDERYRFWQKHYAPECEKYGEALGLAIEALKKLQHYEDLQEAGRLVELPCKVGETVYCIVNKKILSGYVKRIRPFIGGDYIDIMLDVEFTIVDPFYHDGRMTTFAQVASFDSRAYCTIAYHTHEEAEAALEGGGQK